MSEHQNTKVKDVVNMVEVGGGGAGREENVQKDLLRGRDHNKYRWEDTSGLLEWNLGGFTYSLIDLPDQVLGAGISPETSSSRRIAGRGPSSPARTVCSLPQGPMASLKVQYLLTAATKENLESSGGLLCSVIGCWIWPNGILMFLKANLEIFVFWMDCESPISYLYQRTHAWLQMADLCFYVPLTSTRC